MGNKILFISATHGDEGFSIEVLNKLGKKYQKRKYGFERIIGNPEALKRNVRYTQADLNRSAPGNMKSEVYEKRRAAEIMKITKKFKYVIDLHGANAKCGIVIIISYPSLQNIILAGMFSVKRVVFWYTEESLKCGPLTQFCKSPGLEIECGLKTDPKIKNQLKKILKEFLIKNRTVKIEKIMKNLEKKEFYIVFGIQKGNGEKLQDFIEVKKGTQKFYPFMSNQYPGIACYKLKKITLEELVLSQTKI